MITVDNTSLECPILKITIEFTLERNPTDVITVDNTVDNTQYLECPLLKINRKSTLDCVAPLKKGSKTNASPMV